MPANRGAGGRDGTGAWTSGEGAVGIAPLGAVQEPNGGTSALSAKTSAVFTAFWERTYPRTNSSFASASSSGMLRIVRIISCAFRRFPFIAALTPLTCSAAML